jgi:folylpolyglutamate synthase/dihydropteroate synthase
MSIKEVKNFLEYNKINIPFKTILVTGTNGKSSTSHLINLFLSKFCQELNINFKIGLFSKPHILKINERIKINYNDITDYDFNYFIKKVNELRGDINLNWFDELVLVSILYFLKNKIDLGIFEIGIGGKNDSTNALNSIINIITNIGLEHTDILGNTIKSISYQKAGIIKDNSFTLTYATKGFKTIYKQAIKKKSVIFNLNDIFKINLLNVSIKSINSNDFNLNMSNFVFEFTYFIKLISNSKVIKNLNSHVLKENKFLNNFFNDFYKILKMFFKDGIVIKFYNPYLVKNYLIAFLASILYLVLNGYIDLVIKYKDKLKKVFLNLCRRFNLMGRFNIIKINNSFLLIDSAKDITALEYILNLFFNRLYKIVADNFLNNFKVSLVFSFSKGKDFNKFKNIYKIIYKNIDKIENIYFLEHLIELKSEKSSVIYKKFYDNLAKISNNNYNILLKLKDLGKLSENKIKDILQENKLIFITGSIYFVANFLELINKKNMIF